AQNRPCSRDTAFFNKSFKFFFGFTQNNALSKKDERFLSAVDQFSSLFDILRTNYRFRPVAADMVALGVAFIIKLLYLRVFCYVDQYRARPAAFSYIKCLGNNF